MNQTVEHIFRKIYRVLKVVPAVRWLGARILQRRIFSKTFRNEIRLLRGQSRPLSQKQSVLFFTAHKCASGYAGGLFKEMARENGVIPIDLEQYKFQGGKSRPYGDICESEGYFFGPFRWFEQWRANTDDFKVIMQLRDPRDMLVSFYYSFGYNHPLSSVKQLRREQVKRRKEILKTCIDDWVLENKGWGVC